ncbi:MAG: DUF3306 domain-containing protein [Pelagimonas sp.]
MSDFWSRRRAAVSKEAAAEEQAQEAALVAARDAEVAEKSDDELLDELGLPEPEALGEGDDFKQFLTEAVPSRLKTRALRQLWKVNPVLANIDGLVDYGEDFTDAATVVENLQSAYQVGKGMMAHVQELARQAEAKAAEVEAASLEDEEVALDLAEADGEDVEVQPELAPEPVAYIPPEFEPEPEAAPLVQRRMRFTFDTQRTG